MDDPTAEKIAANNGRFREANQQIAAAAADYGLEDGRLVPFVCECSDPGCTELIRLELDDYRRIRGNPRWFVHARGHESSLPGAVRLVEENPRYLLVEKVGRAGQVAAELAEEGKTQ
ncbi:MAG: hypothetical protein ACRDM1_14200 [Gaiellaceae bacterium]